METPQDPLAGYFVDKTFKGFTSSSFHFRSISLCPWERKEITGPVFATACTVLSVLENLPFSYSLLHRLLFFRHRKRNPFRASPLGYVLWISDQFLHIQSSQHFLQEQHSKMNTELQLRAHQWGLLPADCGSTCSPILCFPFSPFYCATAQHCQFTFSRRSTVTSIFS